MDLAFFLPLRELVNRALAMGFSEQFVWLLLSIPSMAALVTVGRQFIGLTGFGLMTPIILAVALSLGGWVVLLLFLFVLFSVTLIRLVIRKFRIRFISRMAILMSGVSVLLFLLVVALVSYGFPVGSVPSLVLFLLLIYGEIFINLMINRSVSASLVMATETVLMAIVMALVVGSISYRRFLLSQPEITILLSLVLTFVSARYTGLRLSELIRFRRLISR